MSVTVLIVDDHPVVREGLRGMLDGETGVEVVGEAGDGAAALRAAVELRPDVVLMDLRMPGVNGVDATRRISSLTPAPRCWCSPPTTPTTTS